MAIFFCIVGMDLLKHGESSYPADAWVEAQYMKDGGMGVRIAENCEGEIFFYFMPINCYLITPYIYRLSWMTVKEEPLTRSPTRRRVSRPT